MYLFLLTISGSYNFSYTNLLDNNYYSYCLYYKLNIENVKPYLDYENSYFEYLFGEFVSRISRKVKRYVYLGNVQHWIRLWKLSQLKHEVLSGI